MQKHVNLVDLVKSFPTNIYLQNSASIQRRTSPLKFAHFAEKSEKLKVRHRTFQLSRALGSGLALDALVAHTATIAAYTRTIRTEVSTFLRSLVVEALGPHKARKTRMLIARVLLFVKPSTAEICAPLLRYVCLAFSTDGTAEAG